MITINFCQKWSYINYSIRYVNFDHYWMPSPVSFYLSTYSVCFTLPFADFTMRKAMYTITTIKGSICCMIYLIFFINGNNQCINLQNDNFSDLQLKRKINVITSYWINPLKSSGLNGTRSFRQGMFMLSVKAWAVIKTHFDLNECKLAHLLWWDSCPDSSISMIDQLSCCWWLTGNGG